jgi:hypothetical protein
MGGRSSSFSRYLAVAVALVFLADISFCRLLCIVLLEARAVSEVHTSTHYHEPSEPAAPAHESLDECLFCFAVKSGATPPSADAANVDYSLVSEQRFHLAVDRIRVRRHGLKPQPRAPPLLAFA